MDAATADSLAPATTAHSATDADSLSAEHTGASPDASDAEGGAVCVARKPVYGTLAGTARATPRIVSLPPRADAATLLGLLTSPRGARTVSMPLARERADTDGSSFVLDEDDSVIIVCNSSTEHASARFLQDTIDGAPTAEALPARPIPALHGPSSLPYARCPSGAEGTIIEQPDNVAGVIWGLDAERRPPVVPAPTKAISIRAPPPPLPRPAQAPASVRAVQPNNVIYQVGAAPMARRFGNAQAPANQQTYSFSQPPPFADRTPMFSPPAPSFPVYTNASMHPQLTNYAVPPPPSIPPFRNRDINRPAPAISTSARSKVRAFDHGPLDLEEIRHELVLERLRFTGTPFVPHQAVPAPHIDLAPQAVTPLPQIQQYPVIGQRTEAPTYLAASPLPPPSASCPSYSPVPALVSSPAFSTTSMSSPEFLRTPPTLSCPTPPFVPLSEYFLPDDPAIAKVGHDAVGPAAQYSLPLLAPPRDLRQLRVVSDPYVHASLHQTRISALEAATANLALSAFEPARPRIASCDDEIISLAHLRRPSNNATTTVSDAMLAPIGFQRAPAVAKTQNISQNPILQASTAPQPAALGKPTLGPYRAPRSAPMAKLMLRRLPSMPSLAEEATPPATPTMARGVGLGLYGAADASPSPAPRRVVSESAAPAPPKPTLLRARGPSADGAKGFGPRRAVAAPSPPRALPPSPLRQELEVEDGEIVDVPVPLPALELGGKPKAVKHVSIVDADGDVVAGTPRKRGARGGRKLRDATPHPVKTAPRTQSQPPPPLARKDVAEKRGAPKEARKTRSAGHKHAPRTPGRMPKAIAV